MTRLTGTEHRDWMQSRQTLRRAIETGDLSLPGLVDVVGIIIRLWPLTVSYLKETGQKDSGDTLVVSALASLPLLISVFMFRKKGQMGTSTLTSWED